MGIRKFRRVLLLGGSGMVGQSVLRKSEGWICCSEVVSVGRARADLTNQEATIRLISEEKPDAVILCAAKVGGIQANSWLPKDFIYDNLAITVNVINGAFLAGVNDLLFLGSSCIYPKHAKQPIKEEYLLTGPLEPTNEPYAIAKIAGVKLCESYNIQYGTDYRVIMPTNLFGPGDNYHPEYSHVIAGLLSRFHNAKTLRLDEVEVWGSGNAMREFLYVDDLANAIDHLISLPKETFTKYARPTCSHVNVGTGKDISIRELAEKIKKVVGFKGNLFFNSSKPDGTPRKVLDVSKAEKMGWAATTRLEDGLGLAYEDYQKKICSLS